VNGKALTFGANGDGSYQSYSNDVWIYDIAGNTWTKTMPTSATACSQEPSHPPLGHPYNGIAFDTVSESFFLYGILCPSFNDVRTWKYNPIANAFTNMNPSPDLGLQRRADHAMVYDELNKVIVLFGGLVYGTAQNDTWSYDPPLNKWMQKNPGNAPSARGAHAMTYDTTRKRVVMFGGATGGATFYNDLWVYDTALNTWQQLQATNPPPGRPNSSLAYDSVNDILLMFGGSSCYDVSSLCPLLTDTWKYEFSTNSWTKVNPSSVPTSSNSMDTLIYDASRNVHLLWTRDGKVWAFRYIP
jgi:N-acetylneuraminic acid mutarotase